MENIEVIERGEIPTAECRSVVFEKGVASRLRRTGYRPTFHPGQMASQPGDTVFKSGEMRKNDLDLFAFPPQKCEFDVQRDFFEDVDPGLAPEQNIDCFVNGTAGGIFDGDNTARIRIVADK